MPSVTPSPHGPKCTWRSLPLIKLTSLTIVKLNSGESVQSASAALAGTFFISLYCTHFRGADSQCRPGQSSSLLLTNSRTENCGGEFHVGIMDTSLLLSLLPSCRWAVSLPVVRVGGRGSSLNFRVFHIRATFTIEALLPTHRCSQFPH